MLPKNFRFNPQPRRVDCIIKMRCKDSDNFTIRKAHFII